MAKVFQKLPVNEVHRLIDWAEEQNLDWEVWDWETPDPNFIELWLEKWPEEIENDRP